MFRFIISQGIMQPRVLFQMDPIQIAGLLEDAWNTGIANNQRRNRVPARINRILNQRVVPNLNIVPPVQLANYIWDHLIYAYCIENTRIYEIFRRVLAEFRYGEKLGIPVQSQNWLLLTEELFYKDPPPLYIYSLTSHIRPDLRATRRNSYYRMFGMDLNHGTDNNRVYLYEKPNVSNNTFVSTFEDLLREVWIGYKNSRNRVGMSEVDPAAIAALAERLCNMMNARRQNGNLEREEFFFVAMMSWFHLAVEFNSPIVFDLQAVSTSSAERLLRIAERVGLPAHGKSDSFFHLADPMSRILTAIEDGRFNNSGNVAALYTRGNICDDMMTIITHWSIATGRDMKAGKITFSPRL